MLKIGDRIVYPMHGAGEVTKIEKRNISGEEKDYYVLKMPIGNLKLMIPADGIAAIGLRTVIKEDGIEKVKSILQAKPEKTHGSWNRRFQDHLSSMKTGDIYAAAAVWRNLNRQNRRRRVSSGEKCLLDLAKQILVSELVYAIEKTPPKVEAWIDGLLADEHF